VTFGTPNTIFNKKGGNIEHIVNVVGGSWLENVGGFGWVKNGLTTGYNYSQSVVDGYFGDNDLGKGWDGILAHRVESYLAHVYTMEPTHEYLKLNVLWAWMRIHCPTNVYVALDGVLVTSMIDGKMDVNTDSNVTILVNDTDGKDVIMPANAGYRVYAEATDAGQMDISKVLMGFDPPQPSDADVEASQPMTYDITQGQFYEVNSETGRAELIDKLPDFKPASDDKGGSGSDDSSSQPGGQYIVKVLPLVVAIILSLGTLAVVAYLVATVVSKRRRR
jgi:hypothetical protein